jgi:hypothetical protein
MTTFVVTELIDNLHQSWALGTGPGNLFTDKDLLKPVKIAAANNMVLCAAGDEIDGFVRSIEPFTVNNGFTFGGVQREDRIEVQVGTDQAGALAVNDLVVAGAGTPALGTAGRARVKKGTPVRALWQVIRIVTGTGVAGDRVLIERM